MEGEGKGFLPAASGQGRGAGRPRWAWRAGQMCAGSGPVWGRRAGSRGSWATTRDGRSQETEGTGGREWLEAKEAHRVVIATYLCAAFHSFLTCLIVLGGFPRLPILLRSKLRLKS